MQTISSKIIQLENEYNVQLNFSEDGCVVFFCNTMEADLILYTGEVDKKYIINNFTTNLLNFEVDLELIQDFRPAQANNNFGRQIAPDNVVNEIRYIDSNDVKWSIDTDSAGFIDSLSCSNGVIYITPTDNTGGTDRVIMINSDKGDKILLLQTT